MSPFSFTNDMIQQGDIASAEKYAEVARDSDPYNAAAFVCLGNCSLRRADYNKARDFFLCALDNDAACVEALYNLGKKNDAFNSLAVWPVFLKNEYYNLNVQV